jgi:hypothetical protein
MGSELEEQQEKNVEVKKKAYHSDSDTNDEGTNIKKRSQRLPKS